MICGACKKHLSHHKLQSQIFWSCPRCRGTLFPFASLSRIPQASKILEVIRTKARNTLLTKRTCPICLKKMRLAFSGGGTTELDVCDRCQTAWFDQHEFRLSEGSPKFGAQSLASKQDSSSAVTEGVGPDGISTEEMVGQDFFHVLTTLPIEERETKVIARTLALPILLVACLVFSLNPEHDAIRFGFIPTDPGRDWGLTWILAGFIHAGFGHLFGNCYFLWLFGDNVEDVIGPWQFLELFFLSVIGGHLAVFFLAHNSIPHIGASGGVMGLAVFYALTFPRVRMSYLIPFSPFHLARIRVPIFVLIALFVFLDFLGVRDEMAHRTNVSHLAHLGGALIGLLYWCAGVTKRRVIES